MAPIAALVSAQPEVLILNGGATPHMAPLQEQTWETFSRNWEVDVKPAFLRIQAVLAGRTARGDAWCCPPAAPP